jgi:hypothetical protein
MSRLFPTPIRELQEVMTKNTTACTYLTVNDVPSDILVQLKGLCYTTKKGFMRSILDHKNTRLKRYVTAVFDGTTVIAWCLIASGYRAHVWTRKEYRHQGWAPVALCTMLVVMPPSVRGKVETFNRSQKVKDLLVIARYLQKQMTHG